MFSVVFHPTAIDEFENSVLWYDAHKHGLGTRFSESVYEVLQLIQEKPELYGFSKRPYREVGIKAFPFSVVYKVNKSKQTIFVSAIYHAKRKPEKRFRR